MKIIIDRKKQERQYPVTTIDMERLTYPYAIREAFAQAMRLDGYTEDTINEVFNQRNDTAKMRPLEILCKTDGPIFDHKPEEPK